MFHARERGRTIAGEFFRDGEARRGFGSSFGNILKFAFELKNMVCHIFWPKAKRSKRPTERGRRSKSAERGRGFKWRAPTRSVGRRPFKPSIGGSAKRHTTSWNSERSAWTKDSQAIKAVFSRIA